MYVSHDVCWFPDCLKKGDTSPVALFSLKAPILITVWLISVDLQTGRYMYSFPADTGILSGQDIM